MTDVQPRPTPFLAEIFNGFRARGWDPADLDGFRMEGDPAPVPTPPNPTPPTPPAPDLGALQQAIDDAKATGTTEATATLLKGLGFDEVEDAQAWVKAKRDAERAGMDEATRLKAEAEDAKRAAEAEQAAAAKATADAAKATFDANLQAFLVQCGVPTAGLLDAAVLVTAELGGKIDAKPDDVVAATAKVRERQPALFAPVEEPAGGGGAPSGVPGGPKPKPSPSGDPLAAGRERGKAFRSTHQTATRDDLIRAFGPQPSPLASTN